MYRNVFVEGLFGLTTSQNVWLPDELQKSWWRSIVSDRCTLACFNSLRFCSLLLCHLTSCFCSRAKMPQTSDPNRSMTNCVLSTSHIIGRHKNKYYVWDFWIRNWSHIVTYLVLLVIGATLFNKPKAPSFQMWSTWTIWQHSSSSK